jgi:outer membrane biogenesis lipoprotein LolB
MRTLIASIACFLFVSCSTTIEKMTKNGPQGDTYLWVQNQIGGKATWQNSMGSAFAGDFEKSLADAVQAAGFAYAAWTRQFNEQMFKINELGATVANPNDGIIEVPLQ